MTPILNNIQAGLHQITFLLSIATTIQIDNSNIHSKIFKFTRQSKSFKNTWMNFKQKCCNLLVKSMCLQSTSHNIINKERDLNWKITKMQKITNDSIVFLSLS